MYRYIFKYFNIGIPVHIHSVQLQYDKISCTAVPHTLYRKSTIDAFILYIINSTVQYSTVQYSTIPLRSVYTAE